MDAGAPASGMVRKRQRVAGVSSGGVLLPAGHTLDIPTYRALEDSVTRAGREPEPPGALVHHSAGTAPSSEKTGGTGEKFLYAEERLKNETYTYYFTFRTGPENGTDFNRNPEAPWPEGSDFIISLALWVWEVQNIWRQFGSVGGGFVGNHGACANPPSLSVGWSPTNPVTSAPAEADEKMAFPPDNMEVPVRFRRAEFGFYPGYFLRGDPRFAELMVPEGNFRPRPGDRAWANIATERERIQKFRDDFNGKHGPAAQSLARLKLVEYNTLLDALEEEVVKWEQRVGKAKGAWEGIEAIVLEIEEANEKEEEIPGIEEALHAAQSAYEEEFMFPYGGKGLVLEPFDLGRFTESGSPVAEGIPLSFRDIEEQIRAEVGSYMNGLPWAYRIPLSDPHNKRPFARGIDLTSTSGYLVLAVDCAPGTGLHRSPVVGVGVGAEIKLLGRGNKTKGTIAAAPHAVGYVPS